MRASAHATLRKTAITLLTGLVLAAATLGARWRWGSRRGKAVAAPSPALGIASPGDAAQPSGPGSTGHTEEAAMHPGRDADSPVQIPARGWLQIGRRTVQQIGEDRVMDEAASVTFYTLLALFPALAALVSLYGLVADPRTIAGNLDAVSGFMPGGGMQIIGDQLKSLTSGPPKALGFGVVVGLATSLWSANAGIKGLFDALNVVYGEKEQRGFIKRTLITLGFTLGALVFLIVVMAGLVALPAALSVIGLQQTTASLLKLGRWPILLVLLALLLALLYRYGPSRHPARWRWVTWGGSLATIVWLLVSLLFSFYVEHFGNYNKTYGSLGAAVGFMTWIWISTIVVLSGAELNAEMEHQTAKDTTHGAAKPMGARHATMADEVA
ncbi:YihY/virulence factor BrkB family protein [Lichenicoccus sp.]|uniref:YihY/virulence factor BrkB family protein n=1 Tax=Lichenicoccus sp. TaxID=2781899 RepID=UPI003D0EE9CF